MSKVIDATLKLNDQFTGKLGKAVGAMQKAVKQGGALGTSIQKAGDKISKAGAGLTKTFTLPILAVGGASYAAWKEVDAGMDGIAKATGATGDKLQELQDTAQEVFKSMPTTMDNVSVAIGDINTRFGLTGDALEEASTQFIKFADVNNTDMSTSIANVSRYMGDAGIDASELGNVLDQLTTASQQSGITVDTLSEQCTKFGAPMRALGLTTEESISMFASWEKAGVNTDIAFSGMKKAISNWGKEGKDSREEFKKTLDTIKACPDIASATSKAIEVFGAKAGPDLADAIQAGRFEYEDMLNLVEGSKGQLSATYDETLDPVDKFKTAINKLKIAGFDLFNVLQAKLAPIIDKIGDKVDQFTDWLGGLNDEQITTGLKIAGVVAAIGPVLSIVGKVVSAIGIVVKVVGAASSAFSVISGAVSGAGGVMAVLTGPVGIVIAAIAAIIAIGVALWKNWDTIKLKLKALASAFAPAFNGIKSVISSVGKSFSTIGGVIARVGKHFADLAVKLNPPQKNMERMQAMMGVLRGAVAKLAQIFAPLGNAVKTVFANIAQAFVKVEPKLKALGDKFVSMVQAVRKALAPLVSVVGGILGKIFSVIGTVLGAIMSVVGPFISGLSTAFGPILDGIMTVFGGVIDFITGIFSGNWSQAWDGVVSIFTGIFEAIGGFFKGIINGITGAVNVVINAINGCGFTIPDWVPIVGGKGFHLDIPTIPQLYKGTNNFAGGTTSINERGGEIIDLPHGSRVYPHDESVQMAREEAGSTITIAKLADSIIIREDADIDRITDALVKKLNKTRVAIGGSY